MKLKLLTLLVLVGALLLNGCAGGGNTGSTMSAAETLSAPAPHVQELIDRFNLEVVDYDYVQQTIGNGTRSGAQALLVDARPNLKYVKGTIPSSISIPDTQIEKYIGQLDAVVKDREIIVFCGGWKCEKSPIVAGYLQDAGYTNVKLYQAGEPDWAEKNYLEVGIPVVEAALEKDSALLMDARPRKKYLAETIPGAVSMYDQELDRLAGRFPTDKSTPIIAFCGGYECDKSHTVARKLIDLGYGNVSVFAAGLPSWKKEGLATTASAAKKSSAPAVAEKPAFVDGVKVGIDEGTVDGIWYNELIQNGKVPANIALVDVRNGADFAAGHLPEAINIEAGALSGTELAARLPKGKVAIFACGTGARAMEAYFKLKDGGQDVSKVLYFDANISCNADNVCTVEVNEPLG